MKKLTWKKPNGRILTIGVPYLWLLLFSHCRF